MFDRRVSSTERLATMRRVLQDWAKRGFRFARKKPLGAAGALLLLALVATAILAPLIAPYSPYERVEAGQFVSPGLDHLFGTDQFGRDVLSRIVYGSRNSLRVSIMSVVLGASVGVIVGLSSGYLMGKYDMVVQRVVDVVQGFPTIVLALAIVAVLGASTTNIIIAIGTALAPGVARIMRSSALSIREMIYVEAARTIGASHRRIILRHVLPNAFAPLIIAASAQLGGAILTEASLSFLGLGTQEPEASWGLMLSGSAAAYARLAPWVPIFPGLAITMAVFSVNVWGDALRDTLDPRLRGT